MQNYSHKQIGTLTLVGLAIPCLVLGILTIFSPSNTPIFLLIVAIFFACMVLFGTLSVRVSDQEVVAGFGPGWIRRKLKLADIQGSKVVKNPWYYGWGIRLIPHGWMFNVSGFDAVELSLKNNRVFRIGTDDPIGLQQSITDHCQKLKA